MPEAVVVAGIEAAGAVGGAVIGSRGADKASKRQAEANRQALQFEREKEERRRAEYDRAMRAYEAKHNAYENRRLGMMRRYGMSIPDSAFSRTPDMAMATASGGRAPSMAPMSLGSLSRPLVARRATQRPSLTMADLTDW